MEEKTYIKTADFKAKIKELREDIEGSEHLVKPYILRQITALENSLIYGKGNDFEIIKELRI